MGLKDAEDIQIKLGLTMPDPVEARRSVYELFNAYRICQRLLGRHFVEHAPVKIVRGYENFMSPDDIRIHRVYSSEPRGYGEPQGDEELLSGKELTWLHFVRRMDERVNRLSPTQRDLIRYRFLDNDPMPSDDDTYAYLYEAGWTYSFRQFEKAKREAVQMIAAGLDADS